jgi:hypothetical protein
MHQGSPNDGGMAVRDRAVRDVASGWRRCLMVPIGGSRMNAPVKSRSEGSSETAVRSDGRSCSAQRRRREVEALRGPDTAEATNQPWPGVLAMTARLCLLTGAKPPFDLGAVGSAIPSKLDADPAPSGHRRPEARAPVRAFREAASRGRRALASCRASRSTLRWRRRAASPHMHAPRPVLAVARPHADAGVDKLS